MNTRVVLGSIAAYTLVLPALADWYPPVDPRRDKWVQMPQMNGGYDVLSSVGAYPPGFPSFPLNKLVADDWMCNDPRPVTDIHFWGSWWQDQPLDTYFYLSIYTDVPAVPGVSYSRPGNEIWSYYGLPTSVRVWGTGNELFYDPNGVLPIAPEHTVWQYNFELPPRHHFNQVPGTVYWLSVQAANMAGDNVWGWKTSEQHWNDDATWVDNAPWPPDWNELRDPLNPSQSLDMAFVLTVAVPEPRAYALMAGLGLAGFALVRRARG